MNLRRSAAGGLIAALTVAFLAVGAPSAAANSSHEAEFVREINAERAKRGKGTLSVKSDLVEAARRHSKRMAKEGDIWHNDNLGNEIKGWYVLGENVGMGPSVESLHQAFMDSEGHRKNILLSDYNQVGVGVVVDNGTIYVTEVFAGRSSSPAPKPDNDTSGSKSTSSSSSSSPTVTAQAPAASPVAAPKPEPLPEPKPRTVRLLVRVIALDP